MCGIAGFVGTGNIEDLKRMNQALIHRGPDDEGLWYDEVLKIYLGHRRLSIIDLAGGHQPMWTSDKEMSVIFNGEIYNHKELRQELQKKNHRFKTDHSDTEVLLHGFREWGADLPSHLNGMWAFAIYDKTQDILFLSRDRFGKKPLYYTLQKELFAFASELTSLTKHSLINASISTRSLKKYFAYGYIPAPSSLYSNIYKLPGGYNLILRLNNLSLKVLKYWDFVLEPFESIPRNPEEEWGGQLRELIQKAVKCRLMSDVPLGIFLSGGMDSSAIAAYVSKIADIPVKTFSIGFDEHSFDETSYSNKMASFLGTEHHSKTLSLEKAKSLLIEIVRKLDEPMGDGSLLPTYLLCKETRKHVTVALGGDGGDELFAGYDPFKALRIADTYNRLIPKPVHKGIQMLAARLPVSHKNMSLDFKIKRTLTGLNYPKRFWNSIWLGTLSPDGLEQLFGEPVEMEDVYSEAIEQWEACEQDNLVDKTLQFYTKLYLQEDILVKVDRASMMHSLEVRSPFLDIDLVNFVRKIPSKYKLKHYQTKYILKKSLESVLPDEILYRHKKGFGIPAGKWFKDKSLNIDEENSIDNLDFNFVKKMHKEHSMGTHDHRSFLWSYWLLSNYVQINR